MGFIWGLRKYIGSDVEVVLSNGHVISGILIRVGPSAVWIRRPGVPGYDGVHELVLIRSRAIDYVHKL